MGSNESTRQINSRASNISSNFLKETKPIMTPALHSGRLGVNWCEGRQHLDFSFKLSFFHSCYPGDPHLHESSVWVIYPLGWRLIRCQKHRSFMMLRNRISKLCKVHRGDNLIGQKVRAAYLHQKITLPRSEQIISPWTTSNTKTVRLFGESIISTYSMNMLKLKPTQNFIL